MSLAKKFGQLKAGGYIYFINPLDHKVESMPIKKVKVNDISQLHIDITFYTMTSMNEVDIEKDLSLDDLETTTLAAPMGADFCFSMGKIPTAYCTDKGKLEEWIKKN